MLHQVADRSLVYLGFGLIHYLAKLLSFPCQIPSAQYCGTIWIDVNGTKGPRPDRTPCSLRVPGLPSSHPASLNSSSSSVDDPREIIRRRSLPKARSTECVGPIGPVVAIHPSGTVAGGVDGGNGGVAAAGSREREIPSSKDVKYNF